jgi:hypothetical protein
MVTARRLASALVVFALGAVAFGCKPEFDDRNSQITSVRIIGARSVPAEVQPGKPAAYDVLVVGPEGTISDAPIDWAFCTEPKPVNELNDVSILCFRQSADWIVPLGVGEDVSGKTPKNGCNQFGPDVPQADPGQPPGRPADPDSTGGYYQPLRLILPQGDGYLLGLAETRLVCGLPGATQEVLKDFSDRYRPNENPTLTGVDVVGATTTPLTPDDGTTPPLAVGRGQALTLRASWPACPETAACGDGICSPGEDVTSCADDCPTKGAKGCGGAEPYVYFDPVSRTLVDRHESMRVAWFATGGSFDSDHTGREEDEYTSTSSDDGWTAPEATGTVHLWVVLHDARGGVDWKSFVIDVQ